MASSLVRVMLFFVVIGGVIVLFVLMPSVRTALDEGGPDDKLPNEILHKGSTDVKLKSGA